MKRVNRRIDFNETGRHVINDVSESYYYKYFKKQKGDYVKVTHLTSYQICDVYTNKNNNISAYLKLNGDRATYKMVFDHKGKRLSYKNSEIVAKRINANPDYNCHGLTFLDRMFWLELDNDILDTILKDDKYEQCTFDKLKEGGVALYFKKSGKIHHSARIMNGNLISKFGINDTVTIGEPQLKKYYKKNVDFDQTRYYNP